MSKNVVAFVLGCSTLLLTAIVASGDRVSDLEEEVFRFVNEWPDWFEQPLWVVMQTGSAAAIVVAAAVAFGRWRDTRAAVGLLVAGWSAWLVAKAVKQLIERERPVELLDGVIERPAWEGLGFVSGHAAVVAALATVIAALVGRAWAWSAVAVATVVAVARVYTGAHLPLDVVGGAALGIALGAAVNLALAARDADTTRSTDAPRPHGVRER